MHIRMAQLEDAHQLATLHKEVHDIHVQIEPAIFSEFNNGSLQQAITDALNDKTLSILVAEHNQQLVGYLQLKKRVRAENEFMHQRKCVYIEQVCVAKQYRHQGVFNLFLTEAKALASEWGFNRVELDVWSNNTEAKASFLKAGFTTYNEKMKIYL